MPKKIRELEASLRDAGFIKLPDRGRGDHSMYRFPGHPDLTLTLDGRPRQDAKPYQEKQVKEAIQKLRVRILE